MGKKKLLIGIVVLLLTASGWSGWVIWQRSQPIPVTPSVLSASGMSVVVPLRSNIEKISQEPEYISQKKIITAVYQIGGVAVTITQQSKPADVSLDQIDTQERFSTSVGTVYVLKSLPGARQSIIETADAWIYVTTSSSLDYATYKQFVAGLVAVAR